MDIKRLGCELRLDWEEQAILVKLADRLVTDYQADAINLSEKEYNLLQQLTLIGIPAT